jgi:hypothetical protein
VLWAIQNKRNSGAIRAHPALHRTYCRQDTSAQSLNQTTITLMIRQILTTSLIWAYRQEIYAKMGAIIAKCYQCSITFASEMSCNKICAPSRTWIFGKNRQAQSSILPETMPARQNRIATF